VTERQKRLERLTSIREQEHTRSISLLHLAQQELVSTENQIHAALVKKHGACAEQEMALAQGSHDTWLIALAEEGMSQLALVQARQQRRTREQAVSDAMRRERETRRELRQMEHLSMCVRNEEAAIETRKEQQQMDECARLMRNTVKHSGPGLELP
jgi:flagellar biosynthesis chaperone FliJ